MLMRLAWTELRREIRTAELKLVALAVILAVACISSISFFSERLINGVNQQAAELLGGDLVLNSASPLSASLENIIEKHNVTSIQQIMFPSVVRVQNHYVLVSVKVVAEGYPLRGSVVTETMTRQTTDHGTPKAGTVWLAPTALALLHAKLGDQVKLGSAELTIAAKLIKEPDRTSNWLGVAPRVFLNQADLPKTQIIQPGSRVHYQTLFKGTAKQIAELQRELKPNLAADQSLQGVKEGRPMLRDLIQRISRYVHLAALLNVLLAGIAIAITVQRYTERHYDTSALLRCMGLSRWQVLGVTTWQWFIVGIVAGIIGCVVGFVLQTVLSYVFAHLINVELSVGNFKPMLISMTITLSLLLGFTMPRLLQLGRVPPLRILQRQLLPMPSSALALYGAGLGVLFLLCWQLTGDLHQSVMVLYALGLFVIVIFALTWAVIQMVYRLRHNMPLKISMGLTQLYQHRLKNNVQVICFGSVFTVLLVLTLVRNDLMSTWKNQLDPTAPNYFLMNIQPQQGTAVKTFLKEAQLPHSRIYPMIRGRLVERNGQPIRETLTVKQGQVRALHRELNLTYAEMLPNGNHLVKGKWWDDKDEAMISVEEGLAERLGLALGDRLGFQIGPDRVTATIKNFRHLRWDSMQPNFYVVFQPKSLETHTATLLLSFYLPAGKEAILAKLLQQFPNVSLLDIAAILDQMRVVINKMTWGILYILMFSLAVGILVFIATLRSSLDERIRESALLKALGAPHHLIRGILMTEWFCLGTLAGLFAAIGATIMAAIFSARVIGIDYHTDWRFFVISPAVGWLLLSLLAKFNTRLLYTTPPSRVLNSS